ncbi:MAG TPA: thiamine phosphate synthase [Casimicrobiaceae bacterium]
MRSTRVAGLYAVTPDEPGTELLVAKVVAAVDGGARVVQYRNKTLDPRMRRAQAQALAATNAIRRALFIVNDDPIVARDLDADGVHLGEDDGEVAQARACVGPGRIIGVSCYDDVDRARAAVAAGADYVAFGSFFASTIKPGACRASVDLLTRARALGVPVVAIGGITAKNASVLIGAGADAVAVISDVFAHDDPTDVTRAAGAIAELFRK